MKNRNNNLRSRATAFLSLRVVLILGVLMVFAGFGAASAWNGGFGWLSIRKASAESNAAKSTTAVSVPFVVGACDVATAGLPIEVESTAGTAAGVPTSYANLGAVFTAINAGVAHQGVINVEVCFSSTETAAMFLNSGTGAAPTAYTVVNIYPLADGLTISGPTITGRGLIELNGADNVTIDGDNPNSAGTNRNLTITNTAAVTVNLTSVLRIAVLPATVASADTNTFRNLNINGSATGRNAAANTSTTNSENSSFGIYAGGLATGAITAPGPLTSVSTNTATAGTTINTLLINNNAVNACARGIFFNGAATSVSTGVTISNNLVGDQVAVNVGTPPYIAPTTTVYTKPIYVMGTTALTITGNSVKNILSYVGTAMNGVELVSPIGGGAINISGNTIDTLVNNGTGTSSVNGITIPNASTAYTVSNNIINNIQGPGGTSTSPESIGIRLSTAAPSATVAGNKVTTIRSRTTGGTRAGGIVVLAGSAVTIQNNFVADVMNTGNASFSNSFNANGILLNSGNNHKVYHNSVNLFGVSASIGSNSINCLGITANTQTGIDVRNNIFSNTVTGGAATDAHVGVSLQFTASATMLLTLNNNAYYTGSIAAKSGVAYAGSTSYAAANVYSAGSFNPGLTTPSTNFRSFSSALGVASNDNASFATTSAAPFMTTTNLHIIAASVTLLESGGAAVGLLTDIDGDTRPNGTAPDIGADEFSGVAPPANDIAATTINNPANGSGFFNGSTITTPQATFTNVGIATQTSIPVKLEVVGPGGYSYTDATQVIASLTPGASFTQTFLAMPTFTTVGTYTATATCSQPGDAVPANNSVVATFTVVPLVTGGTTTVGTGQTFASLTNPGGVFDSINTAGASVTSNITVEVATNLSGETGAISLNEIPGGFTVLIKPTGIARTITGASSTGMINFSGADFVTINGSLSGGTDRSLTVTNTGSGGGITFSSTVGLVGAHDNTVKNVNVIGGSSTATIIGIAFQGSTFGTAGTDNDNNRVENCDVRSSIYGIFSVGASAANKNTGVVITKNQMTGTGAARIGRIGIFVGFDDGGQITENNINGIDSAESADAVGIAVGTQSLGTTTPTPVDVTNALISRNNVGLVRQTNTFSAAGITLASGTSGTNTVSNNMVYGVIANANAGDIVVGIYVVPIAGSTQIIDQNSVSMTGDRGATTGQYGSFGCAIAGADQPVTLRNNIFFNTQTQSGGGLGGRSYAIAAGYTTFVNLNSDFNDLFVSGAQATLGLTGAMLNVAGGGAGIDRIDLAAWQGATAFSARPEAAPNDTDSQSIDPSFVSLTDLHLQGTSTLLGVGTPLVGIVNNDFDNDLRDDIPDIGADEIVAGRSGTIPPGTYRDGVIGAADLAANTTFTGVLTLSGFVTTGPANNLIIDCTGSVAGASSSAYVIGNVRKNFCSGSLFSFPVGAGGYTPMDADVTAGTFPSSLTVRVDQGDAGAIPPLDPLHTLNRFFTLTEGVNPIQANLFFRYLDGDVNGNELTYQLTRIEGTTAVRIPFPTATVDTVNNTMAINNVTNFSKWTATEPLSPTNTQANISGHVVNSTGAPLGGVTMTLLDTVLVENRTTVTDGNGAYHFDAILTGRQIVVTPSKNGYTFDPQNRSFGHTGDIATVDFAGTDSGQTRSIGNDFDGDGKADLSVFRPSDATWYTLLSSTGVFKAQQWGLGTDKIVPADYDGDHVTDVAVFRPSNGTWYINQSSTNTLRSVNWGLADDIVTPADFDGDGQADIAVFRPSTGTWYIIDSHNGQNRTIQWGMTGDRPVAADYDGDGKADIAVWRPSNGIWYVMKADGNYTNEHWGIEEDRQVVGDYDGDNKADMAVFRPSTATWYVKLSSDNSIQTRGHGTAADILVPADYDGDGKTDRAVWQLGGDWNILRSTTNTAYGQKWGTIGDIPTTSAYVR